MGNVVVVGTQWGDEGKGRVTDLLAAEADIVARFSGGDNAGHTVVAQGHTLKLHLVPSGVLRPDLTCLIGAGVVIPLLVCTLPLLGGLRRLPRPLLILVPLLFGRRRLGTRLVLISLL